MGIDKSILSIVPIVDEMGEERFKEYMKAYLEINTNEDLFFEKFSKYIENCKADNYGYKRISVMSFKSFLLD